MPPHASRPPGAAGEVFAKAHIAALFAGGRVAILRSTMASANIGTIRASAAECGGSESRRAARRTRSSTAPDADAMRLTPIREDC